MPHVISRFYSHGLLFLYKHTIKPALHTSQFSSLTHPFTLNMHSCVSSSGAIHRCTNDPTFTHLKVSSCHDFVYDRITSVGDPQAFVQWSKNPHRVRHHNQSPKGCSYVRYRFVPACGKKSIESPACNTCTAQDLSRARKKIRIRW